MMRNGLDYFGCFLRHNAVPHVSAPHNAVPHVSAPHNVGPHVPATHNVAFLVAARYNVVDGILNSLSWELLLLLFHTSTFSHWCWILYFLSLIIHCQHYLQCCKWASYSSQSPALFILSYIVTYILVWCMYFFSYNNLSHMFPSIFFMMTFHVYKLNIRFIDPYHQHVSLVANVILKLLWH